MFRVEGKLADKTGMQARWTQDKQASDGHAHTAQSPIYKTHVQQSKGGVIIAVKDNKFLAQSRVEWPVRDSGRTGSADARRARARGAIRQARPTSSNLYFSKTASVGH
jgi:hypothetical protein